ncbi:hypothetical protein KEM56_000140 [Ascosphaera pollenicola]|nr:hypothetical protein KEM56_000140 [Ascosphaera pollenicola]
MAQVFPPAPTTNIDWDNLSFKATEVNGHIECKFVRGDNAQWSAPKFVKSPYLPIHGLAPCVNYGMQAFEGMKAFRHADGHITVFRPDKNADRLAKSADTISVPPVPTDLFVECVKLAVAINAEYLPPHGKGAMYIRPLVLGTGPLLGLGSPEEYTFCVFVTPVGTYHGSKPIDGLIIEDFDRAAPLGTGACKVGGNYAPVIKFSNRAHDDGFGITLHLDSKTHTEIDEFSTAGFVGVRRDSGTTTVIVPDSKCVLDSVTVQSVCHIAKETFGFTVEKRRIPYAELAELDEVMASGTAAVLVPLKTLTRKSTNDKLSFNVGEDKEGGEVFKKLITTLKGMQAGDVEDTYAWNAEVGPAPEGFVNEA